MKKSLVDLLCGPPIEACINTKVGRGFLRAQLLKRFGKKITDETNLEEDLKTFGRWHYDGYRINPGAESLRGVRLENVKNEKGEVIKRIPKQVRLFHRDQVRCVRY